MWNLTATWAPSLQLHPFDSAKYGKIVASLQRSKHLEPSQLVEPCEASLSILRDVHTEAYLTSLHSSSATVARVTELGVLAMLPNWLVQQRVVKPMRYHVSGTIAACGLAMQYGWAVNMGGGMHHAYDSDGSGWCPFDDVYLGVRRLRKASGGRVKRVSTRQSEFIKPSSFADLPGSLGAIRTRPFQIASDVA